MPSNITHVKSAAFPRVLLGGVPGGANLRGDTQQYAVRERGIPPRRRAHAGDARTDVIDVPQRRRGRVRSTADCWECQQTTSQMSLSPPPCVLRMRMCTWSVCVGNVCWTPDWVALACLSATWLMGACAMTSYREGTCWHCLRVGVIISDINTVEFLYSSGSCKASRWYVHMCGSRQGVLLAQHLNGNGKIAWLYLRS